MSSKLAAAKMAVWSGSRVVIASARRPGVLADAVAGEAGRRDDLSAPAPGARRHASSGSPSRFARRAGSSSTTEPRRAVVERGKSLLPAGVLAVEGAFEADDAVEIVVGGQASCSPRGSPGSGRARAAEWVGLQTGELADDLRHEVVHRDDLVVL